MLAGVLPASRHFARAIVMPNLVPPVVTAADARAYRERILAALPEGQDFAPLMTLYLTEATDPADVAAAAADGLVTAVKLYPAGATTNSASGVRDMARSCRCWSGWRRSACRSASTARSPTPRSTSSTARRPSSTACWRRSAPSCPSCRIVLEHVTTADGRRTSSRARANIAATLTVHHLILNRNHLLVGGIRPHYYCLPVVKREQHRLALSRAATGGDPRFFLGTDSAPHAQGAKEAACGCAGVFSAPVALACLAQVFEEEGALDRLEGFASLNGPAFYRLPPNEARITLERSARAARRRRPSVETGAGPVVVFDPGFPLHWRVLD